MVEPHIGAQGIYRRSYNTQVMIIKSAKVPRQLNSGGLGTKLHQLILSPITTCTHSSSKSNLPYFEEKSIMVNDDKNGENERRGVRCSPGAPGDDYTDGLHPQSHWMNFLTEISGSSY